MECFNLRARVSRFAQSRGLSGLLGLCVTSVLTFGTISNVSAQAPTLSFDEFGGVKVANFGASPPIVTSTVAVDPASGVATLEYTLPFVATPGDLTLFEPAASSQQLSDIVRFEANVDLNRTAVFIYSDATVTGSDPIDSPADHTSFPVLLTNVFAPTETGPEAGPNGFFGYVPTAGLPGFAPSVGVTLTYNFISDGSVPEPSALMLAALGLIGLAAWGWRKSG